LLNRNKRKFSELLNSSKTKVYNKIERCYVHIG